MFTNQCGKNEMCDKAGLATQNDSQRHSDIGAHRTNLASRLRTGEWKEQTKEIPCIQEKRSSSTTAQHKYKEPKPSWQTSTKMSMPCIDLHQLALEAS